MRFIVVLMLGACGPVVDVGESGSRSTGAAGSADGEPESGPFARTSDFGIMNDCTPTVPSVSVMGELYEDAPQTLCCTRA